MKKLLLLFSLSLLVSALLISSCTKKEDSPTMTTAKVTYDANGGKFMSRDSVETIDTIVKIGDYVPYPSNPTRPNYVFKGWCEDKECKTLWSWLTKVEKDITLYAKWEDAGGGKDTLKVDAWVSDTAATWAILRGSVISSTEVEILEHGIVVELGNSVVFSVPATETTGDSTRIDWADTLMDLTPGTAYSFYSYIVDANGKRVESERGSFIATEITDLPEHLYIVGSPNGWALDKTVPFQHSSKSVSEDPVFYYVFTMNEPNIWFTFGDDKSIDEGDWNLIFGPSKGNGNNGKSGTYDRRSDLITEGASFMIPEDWGWDKVRLTVNVLSHEYSFSEEIDRYIYFIGATDGWTNAEQSLEYNKDSSAYTGFIYVADPNGWGHQFKFQKVPGDWGTEINAENFDTFEGDITDTGGNNIGVDESKGDGVYYMKVNLVNRKIYAMKVDALSVIGSMTEWGSDLDMTWDATNYCYTLSGQAISSGNEFKFRINHDWGLSLGGDLDNLTEFNGANIQTTSKVSSIKLYPTRKKVEHMYCTLE